MLGETSAPQVSIPQTLEISTKTEPHALEVKPETPQANPEKLMVCKDCGEKLPSHEFFHHRWEKHTEIAREVRAKAEAKRLENARNKQKAPSNKSEAREKNEKLREKGPPPTGIPEVRDLRSRMVPLRLYSDIIYLDTSLLVLYDITRLKDPDYKRTFAEWLTEVVTLFYHEHRHDFAIENLFVPAPPTSTGTGD